MVRIRLSRTGAKKKPFYHVVATDQRSRRDGRYIERLGYFNPVARGQETELLLNIERIEYWQNTGAQASERVAALIKHYKKEGIGEKIAAKQAEEEAAKQAKRDAAAAAKADAEPAPAKAADAEAAAPADDAKSEAAAE